MMLVNKSKILALMLLGLCLGFTPALNMGRLDGELVIEPFFYISVLAPNTSPARNQWGTIMVEQLPKIGIGVDIFDHTGWSQISPRTWAYPGPYPIPSYSDGGYDVFLVGWSWGLDWDPTGLFETASITPVGDNFYQFSRQEYDWAWANYTSSFTLDDQRYWGNILQQILYDELPSIPLLYPRTLYAMDENFVGWDGLLWLCNFQSMENWSIPGQTEFHHATPAYFEDFHIYKYESVYDAQWLKQIYVGLLERSPIAPYYNGYAPLIAENYSTTDGVTYHFHMRDDVKFADGSTLNASDIEYSFNLQIIPEFGSNEYYFWSNYVDNSSVTIINEFEFEIKFLQPYMFLENILALDIVPKNIWESVPYANQATQAETWASFDPAKLFGAGPYYLYNYDSTAEIIHLKRNDFYDDWTGITPYFEDIYFESYSYKEDALAALANGTIDMVDEGYWIQMVDVPTTNTKYEFVDEPGVQEMAINTLHPIIGTGEFCPIAGSESAKHIRKAISHIVPREYLSEDILDGYGRPGVTPCPATATVFNQTIDYYSFDYELAFEHMRQAGYDIPIQTGSTVVIGLALPFLMGIVALIGGVSYSISRFLERKKLSKMGKH